MKYTCTAIKNPDPYKLYFVGIEGYYIDTSGTVYSNKYFDRIRPLKKRINKRGYDSVALYNAGKRIDITVHRLMLKVFVGESALQCNHINGIKKDNRLENLEYCTNGENQLHAYRTGLQPRTKLRIKAKVSYEQAHEIKQLVTEGLSQRKIGERYNICQQYVSDIIHGKCRNYYDQV